MNEIVHVLFGSAAAVSTLLMGFAAVLFLFDRMKQRREPDYPRLNHDLLVGFTQSMLSFCQTVTTMVKTHSEEVRQHNQELGLQRDLISQLARYGERCDEAHRMLQRLSGGQA